MKKIYTFFFVCCLGTLLMLNGCKKNPTSPVSENIKSSEDNAMVDGEFTTIYSMTDSQKDEVLNAVNRESKGSGIQEITVNKSALLPACATVTFDTTTKKCVIDFGAVNCKCQDDLWRRGKIIITFFGVKGQANWGYTVTLDNYYVQDMSVYGTKTVTFLNLNKVNILVKDAGIVTTTGTIKWNCDRTIEKLWGQLTPKNIWDDEYSITGNASGVNREGTAFTVNIEKALKKKVICQKKDFVSGIITIANDKGNTLTVDYDANGDEGCNKLAKVTVNGTTKIITLR